VTVPGGDNTGGDARRAHPRDMETEMVVVETMFCAGSEVWAKS